MLRAAASLLVHATLTIGLAAQSAPTIDWRDDLASARAEAQREDKPLLAVFRCEP